MGERSFCAKIRSTSNKKTCRPFEFCFPLLQWNTMEVGNELWGRQEGFFFVSILKFAKEFAPPNDSKIITKPCDLLPVQRRIRWSNQPPIVMFPIPWKWNKTFSWSARTSEQGRHHQNYIWSLRYMGKFGLLCRLFNWSSTVCPRTWMRELHQSKSQKIACKRVLELPLPT